MSEEEIRELQVLNAKLEKANLELNEELERLKSKLSVTDSKLHMCKDAALKLAKKLETADKMYMAVDMFGINKGVFFTESTALQHGVRSNKVLVVRE